MTRLKLTCIVGRTGRVLLVAAAMPERCCYMGRYCTSWAILAPCRMGATIITRGIFCIATIGRTIRVESTTAAASADAANGLCGVGLLG